MKSMVKSIWRGLSLAIFLIGVVSLSQVQYSANRLMQDKAAEISDFEPVQSFVAKYVEYRVTPEGRRIITGRRSRYVNANGEWREVSYGPTGDESSNAASNQTVVYGGDADGVYAKGRGLASRRYVSPAADENIQRYFRSANYLRNHPEFIRQQDIAGVEAYVLRTEVNEPTSPHEWTEKSYSPKTGFNSLRTVIHLRNGVEVGIEAISIEFKEVPAGLNDDLRKLPFYNQKEQ